MIADIFYDRNPSAFDAANEETHQRAFHQISTIIFERAFPVVHNVKEICRYCYVTLCREIGVDEIMIRTAGAYYTETVLYYDDSCRSFIGTARPKMKINYTVPEVLSLKLSLAELILRTIEGKAKEWKRDGRLVSTLEELNERLRRLDFPYRYHGGVFQPAQDDLSEQELDTPFWNLVARPVWKNVDDEMKDAFDARANGRDDAAYHAAKALESTIKIISDQKNWTNGGERGAANYIDNLVSQNNGRFLEVWEANFLKAFFKDVRNPMGHGKGSASDPGLNAYQTDWAIDFCIGWIKNLIRRSGI